MTTRTLEQFAADIAALSADMPRMLSDYTHEVGRLTLDYAHDNLSGRILNSITGALRSSLAVSERITSKGPEVTVSAGNSSVQYARIHEFGGLTGFRHLTTIPARPYLRPAMEDAAVDALPVLADSLSRALGGA